MTSNNTSVVQPGGFVKSNRSFDGQPRMVGGGYERKNSYRRSNGTASSERLTSSSSSSDISGSNRRRLDSSSSSDTSSTNASVGVGTGGGVIKKKRRSHRPRGCRGGGSRRRRAQRAAAVAATAAAEGTKPNGDSNSHLQQENITPVQNRLTIEGDRAHLANKHNASSFESASVSSSSSSVQGDVNSYQQSAMSSEMMYNDNITNKDIADGYDNRELFELWKASVDNNNHSHVDAPIPNLQLASSFTSSSSSSSASVSSDTNGIYHQNHLNHHYHYPQFLSTSVSMGHNTNHQHSHQVQFPLPPQPYVNNMHGEGASSFHILPSMPQQEVASSRNGHSGPARLPPLPERKYSATAQMAMSGATTTTTNTTTAPNTLKNPYSLHQQQPYQNYHQGNSYSVGEYIPLNINDNKDNHISDEEQSRLCQMNSTQKISLEVIQQPRDQQQEDTITTSTTPAPQRISSNPKNPFALSAMAGSSLFHTSPRSFLMGGNASGTATGKTNNPVYIF